jgi:polysaccharide export outer membrane protein
MVKRMAKALQRTFLLARSARTLAPLMILAVAFSGPASAEYRLNVGDVLDISVAGVPELQFKAAIGADGEASFPMLGPIKAANQPLSELRRRVRELLPTKVFRRRTVDGRDSPIVVQPDEISVSVAEYGPVYLTGDVAKPGSVGYRAGLTALQAIALAGGYDVMRFKGKDPFLESADARSEYYELWIQFAHDQAKLARLRAELGEAAQLDRQGFIDTPVSSTVLTEIDNLESELLAAASGDYRKEKEHLQDSIVQEDARIALLVEQERQEKEGADADSGEYDQTKQNYEKKIVTTARLAEARRVQLFSSTRVLQTTALLAQTQREGQQLRRKLESVIDQRRIMLLNEIEATGIHMASVRTKLQSAGDKLIYTGMIRSQLVRGNGGKPDLTIVRRDGPALIRMKADEDTELSPGDVLEVALRLQDLAGPAVPKFEETPAGR